MPDDEPNSWLDQLASAHGWAVYQVGDAPPPPLIAVCHRHFFTDVVIIHDARTAVAYRTMFDNDRIPPDPAEALWTYSGDADGALAAVFALTRMPIRPLPAPSPYRLPTGELRAITDQNGDPIP
jgi:hypothetical protein